MSQSLVNESLHDSLLAFVKKKSLGALSLLFCMKLKFEEREFSCSSSSSQMVLCVIEPLSHEV